MKIFSRQQLADVYSGFVAPNLRVVGKIGHEIEINVDQLLSDKRNVLLVGNAGSGKTTILSYIYSITSNDRNTVTFIALGAIDSIESFQNEMAKVPENTKYHLILLDGLDEIKEQMFKAIINCIREKISRNNSLKIIATSRESAGVAREPLWGFRSVEIVLFSEVAVIDYIAKNSQFPELIESRIKQSSWLSHLSKTPVFLANIVRIQDFSIKNSVVLEPSILVEYILLKMVGNYSRKSDADFYVVELFLCSLAASLTELSTTSVDIPTLEYRTKELNWSSVKIVTLVEGLGMFGILSNSINGVSFTHKLYHEYYLTKYFRNLFYMNTVNGIKLRSTVGSGVIGKDKNDVIVGIKLYGTDLNEANYAIFRNIDTAPILCEYAYPFYARGGSVELFIVFVGASAMGFALKEFAKSYLAKWGQLVAEKNHGNSETDAPLIDDELVALAPRWARENPEQLQIFATELIKEYGKSRGRQLASEEIATAYITAHYVQTLRDEGSQIDRDDFPSL